MERSQHRTKRFLADEDGNSLIEYTVLLAVILTGVVFMIQLVESQITQTWESFEACALHAGNSGSVRQDGGQGQQNGSVNGRGNQCWQTSRFGSWDRSATGASVSHSRSPPATAPWTPAWLLHVSPRCRDQPSRSEIWSYVCLDLLFIRTARPRQRLVRPVLEPHDGAALVPTPKRSTSPRATSAPWSWTVWKRLTQNARLEKRTLCRHRRKSHW